MLKNAIDAFISGDAPLAHETIGRDDEVDHLERELFQSTIAEMRTTPASVERGAQFLYILRHIERLADHATNISEDVVFLVEARLVQHGGGEQRGKEDGPG
jgi:phosphate transport system protein